MSTLEILCVTMHQKDFSKILQMNICPDVVFANQVDATSFAELRRKRMIPFLKNAAISFMCSLVQRIQLLLTRRC